MQEVCANLSWQFNYGAGEWQNLLDLPDDGEKDFATRAKYFLLLWQDEEFILSDYGVIKRREYEGEALFCVRSRIYDRDYNEKYENHIKRLKEEIWRFVDGFGNCNDWSIKRWKEIEVENKYDTNLDGLLIKFFIRYDGLK